MMNQINYPTFGLMIRALRLGFNYSDKHDSFIRIQGNGPWIVTICGTNQIPSRGSGEHIVWWEKGMEILETISPLRGLKSLRERKTFVVDERGKEVK